MKDHLQYIEKYTFFKIEEENPMPKIASSFEKTWFYWLKKPNPKFLKQGDRMTILMET